MAVGLNSRPKEWSRPPEPHPPDAGCWCSRNKRRPDVSLIWCSTPSGHRNGLRLWIQTNGRKTALQPLNLTLDFEHAHVSGHSRDHQTAPRPERDTQHRVSRSRGSPRLPRGRDRRRSSGRRIRGRTPGRAGSILQQCEPAKCKQSAIRLEITSSPDSLLEGTGFEILVALKDDRHYPLAQD